MIGQNVAMIERMEAALMATPEKPAPESPVEPEADPAPPMGIPIARGSRLLISEPPLQVLPSLACAIGLNEAIFVQQLHYWLSNPKAHTFEGRQWVYNTYDGWREQFPFWSVRTIRRIVDALEGRGILLSTAKFNSLALDKTKWYSLDYEELSRLPEPSAHVDRLDNRSGQNGRTHEANLSTPITRDYTETTTEIPPVSPPPKNDENELRDLRFEEWWGHYPRKVKKPDAKKSWGRAYKKPGFSMYAAIMAVEQHKRSDQWTKDGGAFIPHPATWLNNEMWNDTLPEASEVKPKKLPRPIAPNGKPVPWELLDRSNNPWSNGTYHWHVEGDMWTPPEIDWDLLSRGLPPDFGSRKGGIDSLDQTVAGMG